MRKAIVYASVHHGNTEKIVKSIAEECQVDLIDAVKQSDADLSSYDMIGFASGIYFSKFHQLILEFTEKNLPERVRTKSWTTIGLRKEPFYVFKRTKRYCTTDISSNRVCN